MGDIIDDDESSALDEEQLFFKRFPAEKQEQIRGLVNYTLLMGLTGKDLVSIGGKLERLNASRQYAHNKKIIAGMNPLPIGRDKFSRTDRFKLKTLTGQYNFERKYSTEWRITSIRTKASKTITTDPYEYELGKRHSWDRRSYFSVLLDVHNGKLLLDF
jgi:hypothetical protein